MRSSTNGVQLYAKKKLFMKFHEKYQMGEFNQCNYRNSEEHQLCLNPPQVSDLSASSASPPEPDLQLHRPDSILTIESWNSKFTCPSFFPKVITKDLLPRYIAFLGSMAFTVDSVESDGSSCTATCRYLQLFMPKDYRRLEADPILLTLFGDQQGRDLLHIVCIGSPGNSVKLNRGFSKFQGNEFPNITFPIEGITICFSSPKVAHLWCSAIHDLLTASSQRWEGLRAASRSSAAPKGYRGQLSRIQDELNERRLENENSERKLLRKALNCINALVEDLQVHGIKWDEQLTGTTRLSIMRYLSAA